MADHTETPPTKSRWPGRTARTVGLLLLLGIVASVLSVVVGYATTTIPDPNADFQTNTSFVYYRDGKTKLGSLSIQNRQSVDYDEMSPHIKDAIVAAENRTFWTDPGFSVKGMTRAAWAIATGGDVQGGSTITQQYIKIYYLNPEQTVQRKVKEVFLSAKIGRTVPKQQILTDYLNTIYFGRGAYGIQAASRAYFNTDAKDLTVSQAAVLASVVNNPSQLDPSVDKDNRDRLLDRYRYVLQGMQEAGKLTPEQEQKYGRKLPKFPNVPVNQRYAGPQGFLLKMTERELIAAGIPEEKVNGGGLKIITTFDKDSEDAAIDTAESVTKRAADAAGAKAANLHAAIASVDVGSGEVRAIYGGPSYISDSRNWATTPRPTASAFKTFALAAGLENGFSLRSVVNGNTFTPPGDLVPVRNEFSTQYGPVSLLRATALSINTAFVDLATSPDVGAAKITEQAEAAGAPKTPAWPADPRNLALGAAEVSPLNMANAYATYGNGGVRVNAHVVTQVTEGDDGPEVYRADPQEERAVPADVARDVTYALTNVVEQGTGTAVRTINRPAAAKTGTKDGTHDDIVSAWFVGYTKQVSTAVMFVAGKSGTSDLDQYARPGDRTFFGGTYPAQTWATYMQTATEDMPVEQFGRPAYGGGPTQPTFAPTYAPPPTGPTWAPSTRASRPSPPRSSPTARPSATAGSSRPSASASRPSARPSRPPTSAAATASAPARVPPSEPAAAPKPHTSASWASTVGRSGGG